ncbi:hypothetical protein UP17_05495 [Peribacillus simplex]|nr:hypothetical protein UP17_05495 [Peribacillus simplex]
MNFTPLKVITSISFNISHLILTRTEHTFPYIIILIRIWYLVIPVWANSLGKRPNGVNIVSCTAFGLFFI